MLRNRAGVYKVHTGFLQKCLFGPYMSEGLCVDHSQSIVSSRLSRSLYNDRVFTAQSLISCHHRTLFGHEGYSCYLGAVILGYKMTLRLRDLLPLLFPLLIEDSMLRNDFGGFFS
ncbi:cytoplasmic protein [Moniliophthora roreri]|nr:cytoplasmic protein [Moniliophthora roreri]